MAKEYIERDSMLEEITAIMFGKPDIDLAQAAVKYAPAADVVEVVRCKDCAWSRMIVVNGKPEYYCQCWNPGNIIHVDARGFCMWGERKEWT